MDYFMCTLCSRKYSSSKTFEKHIRRCQDKRKLACPECHKEVIGQVQLDDHRRSHRGVDCNLCGERIPANSVSAHKAKVHGTSKTVKCDQCPFETKHQAYLSKHTLKHVPKEKIDYPCDQCSKTFNMKRYLTQHKKTHLPHHLELQLPTLSHHPLSHCPHHLHLLLSPLPLHLNCLPSHLPHHHHKLFIHLTSFELLNFIKFPVFCVLLLIRN